jgi:hypothetical protein
LTEPQERTTRCRRCGIRLSRCGDRGPSRTGSNVSSRSEPVLSLKPFQDDVFRIGETLIAIATDTEQMVERFWRDKLYLGNTGRYYRFKVARGLEDIGLEESKKRKKIVPATRRNV